MSATSKIFFNRKDWRAAGEKELEFASIGARGLFAELAVAAAGCEDPGYLTKGGKPMGLPEIAEAARVGVSEAGALLKELVDYGAVFLTAAGVLCVKMVAQASARSAKASVSARARRRPAQGNLFEKRNISRFARGHGKNNVVSMRYQRRNSPFYTPLRDKKKERVVNVFHSYHPAPASLEEANEENRRHGGCQDPARDLRWAYFGKVVKLRACEIVALVRRYDFSPAQVGAILKRHNCWMQTLPVHQQGDWRRFLIAYCNKLEMNRRRGNGRRRNGSAGRGNGQGTRKTTGRAA